MKKISIFLIMLLFSCSVSTNINTNPTKKETSNSNNTNNSLSSDDQKIIVGENLQLTIPSSIKNELFPLESSMNNTILKLEKTIFAPEENILLSFKVPDSYNDTSGWVGTFTRKSKGGTSLINNESDLTYTYFSEHSGKPSFIIKAPTQAGIYEFRANEGNDDTAKETNKIKFVVSQTDKINDTVFKLSKLVFKEGEPISLDYEIGLEIMEDKNKQPWIGIVPSNIPHIDADLNMQNANDTKYLEGKNKRTIMFSNHTLPVGKYDIRFNDDLKGKELGYISFEVKK